MARQRLSPRAWLTLALILTLAGTGFAQEPIDLFPNSPELGPGFIRIGAWNLRHINLENNAELLLPGDTRAEDFESLVATFAKAIKDLGLDVVVITENQPRAQEPDRLQQIRDKLNGPAGTTWDSDQTNIPYTGSFTQFGHRRATACRERGLTPRQDERRIQR